MNDKNKEKQFVISWVEDDIDVFHDVMAPLEDEGFLIEEFRTYTQAIDGIETLRTSDLIVLDLILPHGKATNTDELLGLTLLRQLRAEFEIKIPVIILSVIAHATEDVSETVLKSLDACAIAKPVHPEYLQKEVFRILGYSPKD